MRAGVAATRNQFLEVVSNLKIELIDSTEEETLNGK